MEARTHGYLSSTSPFGGISSAVCGSQVGCGRRRLVKKVVWLPQGSFDLGRQQVCFSKPWAFLQAVSQSAKHSTHGEYQDSECGPKGPILSDGPRSQLHSDRWGCLARYEGLCTRGFQTRSAQSSSPYQRLSPQDPTLLGESGPCGGLISVRILGSQKTATPRKAYRTIGIYSASLLPCDPGQHTNVITVDQYSSSTLTTTETRGGVRSHLQLLILSFERQDSRAGLFLTPPIISIPCNQALNELGPDSNHRRAALRPKECGTALGIPSP